MKAIRIILLIMIIIGIILLCTQKYWVDNLVNFILQQENFSVASVSNENILWSNPTPNDQINSPLLIKGEARGTWFFEASFPVVLTDWDGKIIARGIAQAEGDWMTTGFVPFTATLDFTKPSYGKNGFLILKKDNPSGLPQNDASAEIPVRFE